MIPATCNWFAPAVTTKRTLRCERCATTLLLDEEAPLPTGWMTVQLSCTAVLICPTCVADHGGSRRAVVLKADEFHTAKGGCAGCKKT